MTVRFIHTADIHLDSPLCGLYRYQGAPEEQLRGATRRALESLVDLAIEEKVDFILIAGDLYDGDWRDYNTGLFFVGQMGRLREADIPVYVVQGNHDAASSMTRRLRLPTNVHIFATDRAETKTLDHLGVAIHGHGFAKQATTEDLSLRYPDPISGQLNIGLLHTCAGGREGHESYAPCSLDYLIAKGYDYWALGHVHKREVLSSGYPWIVFPGNTQGRHIRETGAKGCSLITARDGRIESVEHRVLDVLRWAVCEVDASGAIDVDELLVRADQQIRLSSSASPDRLLAMRMVIKGACPAHRAVNQRPEQFEEQLRALVNDLARDQIWLEKIKLETRRDQDLSALLEQQHAVAFLGRFIRELQQDPDAMAELRAEFKELETVLRRDLGSAAETLALGDGAVFDALFQEAGELALGSILDQEERA